MIDPPRLIVTTPSEREIAFVRVFDAPRTLVFDCWTRPDLLQRWLWGPEGWTLAVCQSDHHVGGAYRFVWRAEDGTEIGLGGVYRDLVHPERIVNTQLFDQDWTGGEAVGTVLLSENGGRTTATNTVLYSSREARDAALSSGMEKGMGASYDRLDGLLRSLGEAE